MRPYFEHKVYDNQRSIIYHSRSLEPRLLDFRMGGKLQKEEKTMTREDAIRILASSCISGSKQTEALETLIPELKESEDERIRKEIIKFIEDFSNPCDEECDKWIAYLEKQKEQKPAEFGLWKDTKKELPKPDSLILVQDFDVIRSLYYEGDGYLDKADGIKLSIYQKWCYQSDVKKIKPAEWSEEDENCIRNLESVIYYDKNLPTDTRIKLGDFLKSLRTL